MAVQPSFSDTVPLAMLRIRPSEKRSLETAEREAYVDRVFGILRDAWPDEIAARGEAPVKEALRRWIEALATTGIRTEKPLAKALNVFFAAWVDFAEEPSSAQWIQEILADADGTEVSKVYRLEVKLFQRYES